MKTFTATIAWAAAFAVLSMNGHFTTAEAAPARIADIERPRPYYDKLRRRQGFNDTGDPGSRNNPVPASPANPQPPTPPEHTAVATYTPVFLRPTAPTDPEPQDHFDGGFSSSSFLLGGGFPRPTPRPEDPSRDRHDQDSTPDNPIASAFSSFLSDHNGSPRPNQQNGGITVGLTSIVHHGGTGNLPTVQPTPNTQPHQDSRPGVHNPLTNLPHGTGNVVPSPLPSLPHATGNLSPSILSNLPHPTAHHAAASVVHHVTATVSTGNGAPNSTGSGQTGAPSGLNSVVSVVTHVHTFTPLASIKTTPGGTVSPSLSSSLAVGGTGNAHRVSPSAGSSTSSSGTQSDDKNTAKTPTATILTITAGHTTATVTVPTGLGATSTGGSTSSRSDKHSPVGQSSSGAGGSAKSNKPNATHSKPSGSASPSVTSTPTLTHTRTHTRVSILPTGSNSLKSMTGTFSFADPAPTPAVATTIATTTATTFPTWLPKLVQPADGMPAPPENSTLVQVGFKFGLNYPYVVGKPESASLIFLYLPQGIAYGLGVPQDQVQMNALMPFDTSSSLGFITTLAQTYIPSHLTDQLQLSLHTPASPIYYNPDDQIRKLMENINPTIAILPGSQSGTGSTTANPAATPAALEGEAAPLGGDSGQSHTVKGTSVGIGMGAVAGAAVYAAAMMYVARRYRQKRKGHNRVSSVATMGEMTQRSSGGMGSLFMSGGNGRASPRNSPVSSGGRGSRTSNGSSSNGRSVREQGISLPLMSENSLGWN